MWKDYLNKYNDQLNRMSHLNFIRFLIPKIDLVGGFVSIFNELFRMTHLLIKLSSYTISVARPSKRIN